MIPHTLTNEVAEEMQEVFENGCERQANANRYRIRIRCLARSSITTATDLLNANSTS